MLVLFLPFMLIQFIPDGLVESIGDLVAAIEPFQIAISIAVVSLVVEAILIIIAMRLFQRSRLILDK